MKIVQNGSIRVTYIGALLVTIIFTPNLTYDPVSTPKLWVISVVASSCLAIHLMYPSQRKIEDRRVFEKLLLLFFVILFVNLLVNYEPFSERLYGIRGRNTGFLAYFALTVVAYVIARRPFDAIFFRYILLANAVVSSYFVWQLIGFDSNQVENFYSVPSSTLGNPNFVAGFLGFSTLAILAYESKEKRLRILQITLGLTTILVLFESKSIQGILALLVGLLVYFSFHIYEVRKRRLLILAFPLIVLIAPYLFAKFFADRLLGFLDATSVQSRLDYWQSAIRMTQEYWLTGVGLDGFGDYYRQFRDRDAFNRVGLSQTGTADSAHNVFLDFFANGGIALGLSFLALSLYPTFILVRRGLRRGAFDRNTRVLLSIWSAFQAQSFVSINQLGIAIWGFVLLGAMIAYERSFDRSRKYGPVNLIGSKKVIFSAFVIVFVGILAPTPQVLAEARFLDQAKRSDGLSLEKLVLNFPNDSRRIHYVALAWEFSGDYQRAKSLAIQGTRINPNYYPYWDLLARLPSSTEYEIEIAKTNMKRLDPFFKKERS